MRRPQGSIDVDGHSSGGRFSFARDAVPPGFFFGVLVAAANQQQTLRSPLDEGP